MIWMLYYVVGFWLSFASVVISSVTSDSNPNPNNNRSASAFAAVAVAMVWPLGLPAVMAMKLKGMFNRVESKREDDGSADHGYPTA